MTLFIGPGDGQVAMVFRCAGDQDPWLTTFGISCPDAEDTAGRNQAATRIQSAWVDNLLPSMDTDVTLVSIDITWGTDEENLIVSYPVNLDGGFGGSYLPQNCALHVKKITGFGGRKHKGRMFVPGMLPENKVDNVGNIDGAYADALQGLFVTFKADLEAVSAGVESQCLMVLFHNTVAPIKDEIEFLQVDGVISTQRRRLR